VALVIGQDEVLGTGPKQVLERHDGGVDVGRVFSRERRNSCVVPS